MLIDRVIVGSMYTNAYIVSTGKKECLIIDPGASVQTIIQRLEAMNLVPNLILLTHGHIDHTSAAVRLQAHYAKRGLTVRIGIHAGDTDLVGESGFERNRALFKLFGAAGLQAFEQFEAHLPEIDFFFEEGQSIEESDLVVMHTPGHTAGSVCFYSEPRQALFSGDTLFFNSIGRTDFPEADAALLERNIRSRLFELPPETRIFPGHGPVSAIEREVKNNPFLSDGATI